MIFLVLLTLHFPFQFLLLLFIGLHVLFRRSSEEPGTEEILPFFLSISLLVNMIASFTCLEMDLVQMNQ